MRTFEMVPVEVRFFTPGSVEEIDSVHRAENLQAAIHLVQSWYPQAAFVRCCENEPDGGCVFVYGSSEDLNQDEADAATAGGMLPATYGRWVAIISSADRRAPTCSRPASQGA